MSERLDKLCDVLKAAIYLSNHPQRADRTDHPLFVTVSRQPGTGADVFSHQLAQRLNEQEGANWSAWDRELIEKVAKEQGITTDILEMIEKRPHSWIDSLLQNLSGNNDTPDDAELRVYQQMMMAIRALAGAGHAIIVGQGGVFVTQGMEGGIHVRLVAPLEHRIKYIAERDQISLGKAAEHIANTERNRARFYRNYWPQKSLEPETFAMTLNSAELSTHEQVQLALAIIRKRAPSGS
jgi:cytidylate kinase